MQISKSFPKPKRFGRNVKVESESSNYSTKVDLKNATGVGTSKLAKKVDLASLKSEFDKLNIDKLETTSVDSSKLSNGVKTEIAKKDVFYKTNWKS